MLRLLGVMADEAGLPLVPKDLHWAAADTLGPVKFIADHLLDAAARSAPEARRA